MSRRMLIIFEEEPPAINLRTILEKEGYKVDKTGKEEAIKKITVNCYDLIFIDFYQGEKTINLEIIKFIKRDQPWVPIVGLVFYASFAEKNVLKEINYYFFKPFKTDEIKRMVSELIKIKA